MVLSPKMIGIIFVVAAMAALFFALTMVMNRSKRRSRAMRAVYTPEEAGVEDDVGLSAYAQFCAEALTALSIPIEKKRTALYSALGNAGFQSDEAAYKFFFFRYVIQNVILLVGVIVLLVVVNSEQALGLNGFLKLFLGAFLAYFGIIGHEKVLTSFAKRRKRNMVLEFPDAVDLLLICVESGMGLDAALGRVCKELGRSHPVIASELARTKLELGIYGDRIQALQNLATRCDTQSVRSLVSALVQTEKYGTNLATTLRTLASDYRAERLLNAEARAAKVGVLITLPVVIGVFFPVIALIIAPPVIQVLRSGALDR